MLLTITTVSLHSRVHSHETKGLVLVLFKRTMMGNISNPPSFGAVCSNGTNYFFCLSLISSSMAGKEDNQYVVFFYSLVSYELSISFPS